MFKIIIVDDDAFEMENTRELLLMYFKDRRIENTSIECFVSGRTFLERLGKGERADIYILDIVMPDMDGISVGEKIRQIDGNSNIIFITSSSEYGVKSYDVRAFDYILKPCDIERVYNTLDRITLARVKEKTLRLFVKMSDGIYSLPQSDILYAEYYDHRLIIHSVGGKRIESVSQREPFSFLAEPLLKEKNFIRISASFIINMKYVEKLRGNEFEMIGGIKLPISRTCLDSRSAYMNYILDEK